MKGSMLMLFAIALFSCHQKGEVSAVADGAAQNQLSKAPSLMSQSDPYSDPHARLIKTADYRFRVTDVKRSIQNIEAAIKRYPAHIGSSSLSLLGNSIEDKITIRVRSEFFNDLLKEIDNESVYTHYRNIRTEDVAKQFVDLESRLKTKREVQERYKEILRTRTGKIEELLSAEKQIGELQEEIEAAVSKINFLKDQVAYSTINLEIYETVARDQLASNDESILTKFGEAFTSGLDGAIRVLIAFTRIWPLFIFAFLMYLIFKNRKRLLPVDKEN
jgi:hypothetical protein